MKGLPMVMFAVLMAALILFAACAPGLEAQTATAATPEPTPEPTSEPTSEPTPEPLVVWGGSIAEGFSGGNGTEESPYLIENGAQLALLANGLGKPFETDAMGDSVQLAFGYFALTKDILLNETEGWENWGTTPPANVWAPIGWCTDYTEDGMMCYSFYGSFDGRGHTISGIYVNDTLSYADFLEIGGVRLTGAGLFGEVADNAVICNLSVTESYISGNNNVGSVVGSMDNATLQNCTGNAIVCGWKGVGGIVGEAGGAVLDCQFSGQVLSPADCDGEGGGCYLGGIAGESKCGYVFIENCRNIGTVTASFEGSFLLENMGGHSSHAGGIIGQLWGGQVINCVNLGAISGGAAVGGIAGCVDADSVQCNTYIAMCSNSGAVKGRCFIGGVAGRIDAYGGGTATMEDCHNMGTVEAMHSVAGGITGLAMPHDEGHLCVVRCCNSGTVTSPKTTGGVFGKVETGGSNGKIEAEGCYFLDSVCSSKEQEGVTALTEEQMRTKEAFPTLDFLSVWVLDAYGEYPYPQLPPIEFE